MIARLIACWGVLACLMGFTSKPADPYDLEPVRRAFYYDGTEMPEVEWHTCGQVNAYYYPPTNTVILCDELKEFGGGVIRFILAHELSHGIIRQRHLPIVGSEEVAADELAALVMSLIGHQEDVFAAANWWMTLNNPDIPWDEHTSDMRRGLTVWCIARGSLHQGAGLFCYQDWNHIVATWNTLLEIE